MKTGSELGEEIMMALGVPEGLFVRSLRLDCSADDVARLTLDTVVYDGDKIVTVIKNYCVHSLGEEIVEPVAERIVTLGEEVPVAVDDDSDARVTSAGSAFAGGQPD